MTPTWTGKAGEPVPAMLRHRRATDPTRGAPDGRCACGLPLAPGERVRPTTLCPAAVAQRIAELEAHGASLHKYGASVRGSIARWLEAMAAEGGDPWMSYCADAIARGDYVAWCEANPEMTADKENP